MDVDAVDRRAPELALVDELAHTNAPGMRNEKRYEDIDEILDAGIDVISTVNVQHLESLNDSIFELTGVRVRETFPDRILDEADEVVLVDLAPEALQRAAGGRQGLPAERGRGRARQLLPAREPRRAARARAARGRRGRRGAAQPADARPAQPAGRRRAGPRARRAASRSSQRILRRAWRSGAAARRGDRRALGAAARAGARASEEATRSPRCAGSRASSAPTSSRRRATISSRP